MNLTKAIEKQEREIKDLEDEITILLNLNEVDKAIEKGKRVSLLKRQIELAKLL